jgi:hypothetical protein
MVAKDVENRKVEEVQRWLRMSRTEKLKRFRGG